jgi:two-component system sensor histidine kinase DegS
MKIFKLLCNPHFWYIMLIFLACSVLHYPEQLPFLGSMNITSFLGLERHAIERILFIIPIIYTAFIFGIKGGIVSLVIAFALMLPRVLFVSQYPRDALFEMCLSIAIGSFFCWWIDSRKKEVGKREQIIKKLEVSRKEQRKLQENLMLYTDQISKAHEEERKRIARELHDDTIQTMFTISHRLDSFINKNKSLPKTSTQPLMQLQKEIDDSLLRIRRFIQYLRPPTLEYLGLIPAIRELVNRTKEESDIEIVLKTNEILNSYLSNEQELLIYRIVQEALRNVIKHSKATNTLIKIKSDEHKIRVIIKDNGTGFDTKKSDKLLETGKLGLMGMKERAHLAGGTLKIDSKLNNGTTIHLVITLKK